MAKMVQVFMVVRCYSCETFQVQQVRQGIGMRVFDIECAIKGLFCVHIK